MLTSMRQEVLSVREFGPKGLSKGNYPLLRSPILQIHSSKVFIIDVNTVQLVLFDEARECARELLWVFSPSRWSIS